MLRDAPAGMAFLDTGLRFVWVNPALARMYDRPVNDFSGQPLAAVWPAVDAARGAAAAHQVLEQGSPATETFQTGAAGTGGPGQRTFHWFGVRAADGTMSGAGLKPWARARSGHRPGRRHRTAPPRPHRRHDA